MLGCAIACLPGCYGRLLPAQLGLFRSQLAAGAMDSGAEEVPTLIGMPIQHGVAISLKGVAEYWEYNRVLRSRYRDHRRLFQVKNHPDKFDPKTHIKEAAFNFEVLAPLMLIMGRMLDENGGFQLFTIAQIESEMLARVFLVA